MSILRRTFCLSADPDEERDLTGHLGANVEAELNNFLREYDSQPALAFSTSWKYLGRAEVEPAPESDAVMDVRLERG